MFRPRFIWVLGAFVLVMLAISATVAFAPTPLAGDYYPVFAAPAPPPPRPLPVRAGSGIYAPRKIRDVQPVYPEDAKQARIEGLVILEIDVDAQGHVSGARVIRSAPMLDQAAVDAVKRWEYEPTVMNGTAVPVTLTVTVRFTLK